MTSSQQTQISHRFVIIAAIFVTCLITANIIVVKPTSFGGIPTAIIIFPLSYIVGDILTEVYGYRLARRVIWLGFICNLIAVIAIWVGQLLPPASAWEGQQAYESILGYAPQALFASFLAYLVGEFSNSFILAKMKIKTKGRWLWTRTIGSTMVAQALDAAVFIPLVYLGRFDLSFIVTASITLWLAKVGYEAIATPFTYAVVNYLKKKESIDTYDYETDFNPFSVTQ
ncbi:MAG: queuosine precursor transporter [Chloroflexota bacterium]